MGEAIESAYEWTDDDYIEMIVANRRYATNSPIIRFGLRLVSVIVILVGVLVLVALFSADPNKPKASTLLVVGGLVLVLGLLVYSLRVGNRLNRIIFRQQLRSIPRESRRIEWGCDEGGLWTRTSTQESTILWEKFRTIVEASSCFLFYEGAILNTWLPARGFRSADDLRRFVDLARSKVPNYVVLGECRFVGKPGPIALDEF